MLFLLLVKSLIILRCFAQRANNDGQPPPALPPDTRRRSLPDDSPPSYSSNCFHLSASIDRKFNFGRETRTAPAELPDQQANSCDPHHREGPLVGSVHLDHFAAPCWPQPIDENQPARHLHRPQKLLQARRCLLIICFSVNNLHDDDTAGESSRKQSKRTAQYTEVREGLPKAPHSVDRQRTSGRGHG